MPTLQCFSRNVPQVSSFYHSLHFETTLSESPRVNSLLQQSVSWYSWVSPGEYPPTQPPPSISLPIHISLHLDLIVDELVSLNTPPKYVAQSKFLHHRRRWAIQWTSRSIGYRSGSLRRRAQFDSRPEDRQSWLLVSMISSATSSQCWDGTVKQATSLGYI
jgi:hypothetical protein